MNQRPFYRYYPPPGQEQPPPRTSLWYAIAALIFCFWPAGIVAVVYAVKARNRWRVGDYGAAARYSRLAKIWSWISLAIAIVIVIMLVLSTRGGGTGISTALILLN